MRGAESGRDCLCPIQPPGTHRGFDPKGNPSESGRCSDQLRQYPQTKAISASRRRLPACSRADLTDILDQRDRDYCIDVP